MKYFTYFDNCPPNYQKTLEQHIFSFFTTIIYYCISRCTRHFPTDNSWIQRFSPIFNIDTTSQFITSQFSKFVRLSFRGTNRARPLPRAHARNKREPGKIPNPEISEEVTFVYRQVKPADQPGSIPEIIVAYRNRASDTVSQEEEEEEEEGEGRNKKSTRVICPVSPERTFRGLQNLKFNLSLSLSLSPVTFYRTSHLYLESLLFRDAFEKCIDEISIEDDAISSYVFLIELIISTLSNDDQTLLNADWLNNDSYSGGKRSNHVEVELNEETHKKFPRQGKWNCKNRAALNGSGILIINRLRVKYVCRGM